MDNVPPLAASIENWIAKHCWTRSMLSAASIVVVVVVRSCGVVASAPHPPRASTFRLLNCSSSLMLDRQECY